MGRTRELSKNQHGFRESEQSLDAIKKILEIVKEAAAFSQCFQKFRALITLDIRNKVCSSSVGG